MLTPFLAIVHIDFSWWFHLSTITYFSSNFRWAAWPKIIESPFLMLHYWNGLLTSFSRVANEVKCEFRSTKKDLLMQLRQVIYLPNSSLTHADWHCLHFIYSFSHLYSWIVAFWDCEVWGFQSNLIFLSFHFVVQFVIFSEWINTLDLITFLHLIIQSFA